MIYNNSTMKCPETIFMTQLSLPHLSSLVFFFFFVCFFACALGHVGI